MEGEFRDPIVEKVEGWRIQTYSGSVYEVLPTVQVSRRLSGLVDPTPRQGPDGQWKTYVNKVNPTVGEPMIFDWDGDGIGCTMTSAVTAIEADVIDFSVVS